MKDLAEIQELVFLGRYKRDVSAKKKPPRNVTVILLTYFNPRRLSEISMAFFMAQFPIVSFANN